MKTKITTLFIFSTIFTISCNSNNQQTPISGVNNKTIYSKYDPKIIKDSCDTYFCVDTIYDQNEVEYKLKDKQSNGDKSQYYPYYITIRYSNNEYFPKENKWEIRFVPTLSQDSLTEIQLRKSYPIFPTKGILKIDNYTENYYATYHDMSMYDSPSNFTFSHENVSDEKYEYNVLTKISKSDKVTLILLSSNSKDEIILSPSIIQDAKMAIMLYDKIKNTKPVISTI